MAKLSSINKNNNRLKLIKRHAAKRAARSGAATVIACGREANVLSRLADGEAIGTQLVPAASPLVAPSSAAASRTAWASSRG